MPVWIRGRAPRVLRRTHAFIAFALPLCLAASAGAEEPDSPCNGCEAPPEQLSPAGLEATPSEQPVSEAPPFEPQGGTAPNFGPPLERTARIDAPLREPVPRTLAATTPSTQGSGSGAILGLRLPTFIAFGIGGLGAGGAVVTHLAATAPYTDPKLGCNGRCADGSHTLGMTSTVLAGLAIGALGTGVVLALSEPAREKKPLAPVLKMSVSPSKAAASASWTF